MTKIGLLLAVPLFLAACSPEQAEPTTNTNQVGQMAPAPADDAQLDDTQPASEQNSIVDIAVSNPDFSTLVAALQATGLDEALAGTGPFTVFAPTNAAFEKLPAGTLESLLADPDQLAQILTYHVVEGQVTSSQVATLDSATTLQGGDVTVSTHDGSVLINDATVVTADIMADNGVIHVIDTVLLP